MFMVLFFSPKQINLTKPDKPQTLIEPIFDNNNSILIELSVQSSLHRIIRKQSHCNESFLCSFFFYFSLNFVKIDYNDNEVINCLQQAKSINCLKSINCVLFRRKKKKTHEENRYAIVIFNIFVRKILVSIIKIAFTQAKYTLFVSISLDVHWNAIRPSCLLKCEYIWFFFTALIASPKFTWLE